MDNMTKFIRLALQYGTVEIGYSIHNINYDLTREETNVLSLWANDPESYNFREEFRTMLMISGRHPFIELTSDLLSYFQKYFLFILHTDIMDDDEMLSSLNHLIEAFMYNPDSFREEVSMLKILKKLLKSGIGSVVTLKNDFTKLLDDPAIEKFIFPVFSVGHASYGVCEKNSAGNRFLVAICNGDVGGSLFHDVMDNNDQLELGHCIVPDMNRDEVNAVLNAAADNYNGEDDVTFAAVGNSFQWGTRKLNANDLAQGRSHGFIDQEVRMSCQTRDNCFIFNLNHALRFAKRSFPVIGVLTLNRMELLRKFAVICYIRKELNVTYPKSGVPEYWRVSYDHVQDVIDGWYVALEKHFS